MSRNSVFVSVVLSMLLFAANDIYAGNCSVYWPSGLQSTDNDGKIKFDDNGQLIGDGDNVLQTTELELDGKVTSCNTTECSKSGTTVPALDPGDFRKTDANNDIKKEDGENFVLGSDGTNEYDEIKLEKSAGTLSDSGNYTEYRIHKLTIEKEGNFILEAGTSYWIEELKLEEDVTVTVNGAGTARLYVKKEFKVKENVLINSPSKGNTGDPSKLLIYSYDEFKVDEKSTVSAIVFAKDKFELKEDATLFGAVAAKKDIKIKSTVTYNAAAVSALSVDNLCSSTPLTYTPVAYFELDEFALNGTSGEIVDNLGFATSARALGTADGVIPDSAGKVCYGVDIPDNDSSSSAHAIDTGLDIDRDIGNRGTIDFWYLSNKAWKDGNDRVLFDASTETDNKYFYLLLKDDGKLRFAFEDSSDKDFRIETDKLSIDAGIWTHIAVVWDLQAEVYKIYVNGVEQSLDQEGDNDEIGSVLGNAGTLYFGDNRSAYYPAGVTASADGRFDEIRIYSEAVSALQITEDMNATHSCDSPPPPSSATAAGFNCVYAGLDALTGNLYTRVAGAAFPIDVIALKDSDGNGTADAVETAFAADANRSVTVELVDTSSGVACASRPALTPAVSQTLVFTSADAGRKASGNFTVDKAYRSVGCRVTDANDSTAVVGCSVDSFAIRPASLTVSADVLTNAGASGTPAAKAGSAFALTVSSVAGYDGTPTILSSPVEAHAGGVAGTLAGSFSPASAVTGIATGNNFTYSEVGNFRFLANKVVDTGFTSVDQGSDCIDGSFSNTLSSGKVGCDVGNSSVSGWVGRFTPDHFAVAITDHGALANTCAAGGFSYSGTEITFSASPVVRITAENSNNATTVNYTGDYAHLANTGISIPAITEDGTTLGADASNKVSLGWNPGTSSLSNTQGVMTFSLSDDTFVYGRNTNDLVAPFTADINLVIQSITDTDGVTATGLPLTVSPAGVSVRYGRLNLLNAYGSELQTLPMTLQVEYYNGSGNGFMPNVDDTCTTVNNVVITDPVLSDDLGVNETCIWDAAGNSGAFSCATAGSGADQYSPTPLASNFNLNLKAPGAGNTGVLNLSAEAPVHLKFDWTGAGVSDPSATATFGIHNRNNRTIFLREIR